MAIPSGTTLYGHKNNSAYKVTYWNRQTEADGDAMSLDTIMPMCSAIKDNGDAIELLKAATDVIDVFGTYSAFEENSGTLTAEGYLTDKDIIKVLEDESYSSMQVYYQYTSANNSWSAIGSLDPYYSKSDIDNIITGISADISGHYYVSGNVKEGKNLTATHSADNGKPVVTLSTKDEVEFTGVKSNNISGENNTTTIDNLITSAEEGKAISTWVNNNISSYISSINTGTFQNISGTVSTSTSNSATQALINLSAYKTVGSGNLRYNTSDFTITLDTKDTVTFTSLTSTSIDTNYLSAYNCTISNSLSSNYILANNISGTRLNVEELTSTFISSTQWVASNRYIIGITTLVTNHVAVTGADLTGAQIGEIYTFYVSNQSLIPSNPGGGNPYSAYILAYPASYEAGHTIFNYIGIKSGRATRLLVHSKDQNKNPYFVCLDTSYGEKRAAGSADLRVLPEFSGIHDMGNLIYYC